MGIRVPTAAAEDAENVLDGALGGGDVAQHDVVDGNGGADAAVSNRAAGRTAASSFVAGSPPPPGASLLAEVASPLSTVSESQVFFINPFPISAAKKAQQRYCS